MWISPELDRTRRITLRLPPYRILQKWLLSQSRRYHRVFLLLSIAILIVYCIVSARFSVASSFWLPTPAYSSSPSIPRLIWQTWQTRPDAHLLPEGPPKPNDELEQLSRSWPDRNPGYTYTRLGSNDSLAYVTERFAHRPDIVEVYRAASEPVLRADMIRYLALLADGGVYTDMDTECTRSIDLWARGFEEQNVGLILGVEYDQMEHKTLLDGFTYRVQFVQWTIAARKGHEVIAHVTDKVFGHLHDLLEERGNLTVEHQDDVLELTGPRIFTESVREALSEHVGEELNYEDFSMLETPTMFGDVLMLPINGFASGISHSGSGPSNNPEQLISHQFQGTWREGLD